MSSYTLDNIYMELDIKILSLVARHWMGPLPLTSSKFVGFKLENNNDQLAFDICIQCYANALITVLTFAFSLRQCVTTCVCYKFILYYKCNVN